MATSADLSVEYQALKKYEDELIECLECADLVSLARQAAECGVVPREVKIHLETLHPTVPRPLACRYLLFYVYDSLSSKANLYDIWLVILSKVKVTAGVLSQVRLCYDELRRIVSGNESASSDHEKGVVFTDAYVSALTEVLAKCTSKWREIGTSLGLPQNEIENIFATNFHSPTMCLTKVLSVWVMCAFSTAKPPTLESLEKALGSNTVGLGAVASELRDSLVKQLSKPTSLAAKKSPQKFEITGQTLNQSITEGSSVLFEIRVAAPLKHSLTFEWLKEGCQIAEISQVADGYNGYHTGLLFLHVEDLSADGTYVCCVKHNVTAKAETLDSKPATAPLESEPVVLHVATPIDSYQKKLVDFYTEQPEVPEDTWPPVSCNTYINLALIKQDSIHHAGEFSLGTIRGDVDDVYKDKESLAYEKAFSSLGSGARLLVEGRPGSGKTTLIHKVSQDWARKTLELSQVRLLILVHLRAFSSDPNITLIDLLGCYYQSKTSEIIEYAEKHNGLGFCFILDGLDEYLPQNKEKPFIFRLIKRLALPKAVVIVASRPAAAARFRSIASRQVEVIGFLKEQISDYIDNYSFSDVKCRSLHQYLDRHPNVYHMCYLPIHAAMVCFLFDHLDEDLPQTETEIYKEFTKFTILRILYRRPDQSDICINSVEDLKGPQKEVYNKICMLAYEMCKSLKQVATQAEALSAQDSDSLGLITEDKMAMRCGFQKMYTFLHLTFQEFLAAYYIANLDENRQMELIAELGKAKQMQQVWKFFCGLSKFDVEGEKFKAIISNTEYGSIFKVQCAFESQQSHICDSVIEDNCLAFTDSFLSLSNFIEIAFILTNAHVRPVLSFQGCVFGRECVDVLVEKAGDVLTALCCRNCNFEILNHFLRSSHSLELLDISDGKVDIETLARDLNQCNLQILKVGGRSSNYLYATQDFPQILADAFTSKCSSSFNICFNGASNDCMANNLPSLPFLFCCDYPDLKLRSLKISLAGFKALYLEFMRHPFFTRVTLIDCGIDDEAASWLALGLKYCRDLEILELGFNCIGDTGAINISECVKYSTVLSLLDLTHNKLSDKAAVALADTFKDRNVRILLGFNNITKNCEECSTVHLQTLDISNRDLGNAGVDWLASAIASSDCSSMKELVLSNNSLSHLGMKPLSSILAQSGNLLTLDLSFNMLGEDMGMILSGTLKCCSKLQNLDISSNRLGKEGAKTIAGAIMHCTALLRLKINSNGIRSDGICALVEALTSCVHFQELGIRSNGIECRGAKALAHAFSQKCWKSFSSLDISCNSLAGDGIKVLAKSLTRCTTLKELCVSRNSLKREDAKCLALLLKKLKKNLQVLDVSCNSLQSSGVSAIANALNRTTSIRRLSIGDNDIGRDGDVQSLAKLLRTSFSIQQLDISKSYSVCDQSVADALCRCINIQELNISANHVNPAFIKVLANSFEHLQNLQCLQVSSTNIGSDGAEILAGGLTHCAQLRELYIGDNHIGDSGVAALSGILKDLENLRVLDISSNHIGEGGATIFMDSFCSNCTKLCVLDISGNFIGSVNVEKLSKTIQAIRELRISHIKLSLGDVKFLASGLKQCVNLQKLDINSSNIGTYGAKVLADALQFSKSSLHTLDISDNPIKIDGAYAIAGIFQYSKNLRKLSFTN